MKKLRQILAIFGVVVLAGLYVLTFVTAILDDPQSFTYFKAALAATIAVPVILWFLGMFVRLSRKDEDNTSPLTSPTHTPDEDAHHDGDQRQQDAKE